MFSQNIIFKDFVGENVKNGSDSLLDVLIDESH